MELGPGLYLAGAAAAGFGITYFAGIAFTLEERIAFGTVLGAVAVATVSFVAALAARELTAGTALAGLAAALLAGGAGVWRRRHLVLADAVAAKARWSAGWRSPQHPWPLAAVVLVCGAWTVHFLHQAYVYGPSGLFAGYVNIWGDWAAHLSFSGAFALGRNFPPQYSIDPGHNLGYPFMIDFFAADLVPLGLRLTEALTATTGMLGLAFPAVLYLAAQRFAGGRAAAAIAVFVFLLGGGLGFVYLLQQVQLHGPAILGQLPQEYTLNRDVNLQWLNPVLAYLVPQRSTLFGFSLALIVLLTVWLALHEEHRWTPFVFAGAVTAVMPAFHVHAYGTVVALSAFWAIARPRVQWLALFVPALVIGVPILVWMWPPANNSACGDLPSIAGYCIQPGWLALDFVQHNGVLMFLPDFVWFWLWNTSLLLPLLVTAYFLRRWFPNRLTAWFAPMWLWFVVPNIVVLQPWVWDNTKFFIFWALFGSILVGGLLARMLQRGGGLALAAAAMLVLLCLAGTLDLTRASRFDLSAIQFTDTGGLDLAAWVVKNTPPDATFAVANDHNSPIPTLTGRRELIGYPGWLWTYGLPDYNAKGADLKKILDGDPSAPELVRKYGIDYVMIGPQEVPLGANRSYWDQHGTLVYDDGGYAVYRVAR